MWFVLFSVGAAFVHRAELPRSMASALVVAPPREALYALYFLAAALLRLAIRDARLGALERRSRRAARNAVPPPGLVDVGVGVGKGVAQVVLGGDVVGAAIGGAALLMRIAAARATDPREAGRRAVERRKAAAREQRHAALCIAGVGLACVAGAWAPLLAPRLALAAPLAQAGLAHAAAAARARLARMW
jgi:hypothetical protein